MQPAAIVRKEPSLFTLILLASLFLWLMMLFLPETSLEKDHHALRLRKIQEGYWQKLKNKRLLLCSLLMGCGTSCVYLFASEAPFIAINRIGLTPEQYGLLNFIPPLGIIAGSLLAQTLASKKTALETISFGIIVALSAAALMLLLFLGGSITVWTLFIPMPLLYTGLGMIVPNATSFAMTHAKNKSNASAMMNFLNLGTAVFGVLLLQSSPVHPVFLLPLLFLAFTGTMVFLKGRLVEASKA